MLLVSATHAMTSSFSKYAKFELNRVIYLLTSFFEYRACLHSIKLKPYFSDTTAKHAALCVPFGAGTVSSCTTRNAFHSTSGVWCESSMSILQLRTGNGLVIVFHYLLNHGVQETIQVLLMWLLTFPIIFSKILDNLDTKHFCMDMQFV